MKKSALPVILAAMAAVNSQALAADPSFTGTLSAGFDSEYYFRGLWFSSNNAWTSVNLSIPVADKLTAGVGALYTYSTGTDGAGPSRLDYGELDLIGSLTYDAGFAKFGLVATSYTFFDTFSGDINGVSFGNPIAPDSRVRDAVDIGLTAAIPFGNANFYVSGYYDVRINAPYYEVGADYTFKINDCFSIVPAANIGYGSNYYSFPETGTEKSGFTAARVSISAPYKLTDSFTVTPYVAANFALDIREDLNVVREKNDVFGGLSVSYAF
jgi:hypothetical protein